MAKAIMAPFLERQLFDRKLREAANLGEQ